MEIDLETAAKELEVRGAQVFSQLEGISGIVNAARFVPVQYFEKKVENIDDETFIVKKSHVVMIKRYVRAGLSLPVNLGEIEDYLGYKNAGHPLLEPTSMQQFYQEIHSHALSWATLERETKNIGNRLDLFARSFFESGSAIINLLKETETYRRVEGNIDSLNDDEKTQLASIPLSSTDTKRVESLRKALKYAKKDVAEFYLAVADVNAMAVEFSRKISDGLLIKLEHKLKAVDEVSIDKHEGIDRLREQIKDLDEAIAEKQTEYDYQVGYAFTGLVFGPLGLIVTGGIFGAEAEKTRAQKNELLEQKNRLVTQMSSARLSQNLITLTTNFSEMRALMKDAENGIKCIEDVLGIVWNSLGVSLGEFEDGASDLDLILLVLNLQAIFNPWKTIQGHAHALSTVFNQVVEGK
ncbi:alpha-xenorhabdolysin family binary toxin subunit A [Pseudomonas sp. PDM27]|uniref:alpha-xenorhabdolysin family binary toxin subunit A n=1 Tax=Pseudomonas sp. PDM27 TaxID=2854769 RepID=UPI0009AB0049|nr:alpha-xenorhabdolysin family binary toxin subunit A [Pseudomonas sp. PDM27]MBV7566614.1 alpha-xenorhabdolysin family binary toxin subunit A [Pseudomonas sp. PDM27]